MTALQVERLADHCSLVEQWNRTFNLVSRADIQRLVPRHVMDSLLGGCRLERSPVLDIGSGAGFPGIPLAVAHPDKEFVLCDRASRKVRFLRQVVRTLALGNVRVVEANLGAASPALDDGFAVAVARGVAELAQLWRMAAPQLIKGGSLLVYAATRADESTLKIGDSERVSIHTLEYPLPQLDTVHGLVEMQWRE